MSVWYRFHQDESTKSLATFDGHRFFIQIREPPGEQRRPIEFFRGSLATAREAADRIVQAYYPHECSDGTCGGWQKTPQ